MSRFVDWSQDKEAQDIMEKFLERFPGMFDGFDTSKIGFLMTAKKKAKEPVKLHCVGYPFDVFCSSKVYIVEVFKSRWSKMDAKKKNLAVFRAMCAIPDGGFDEQSKHFAKKLQPEIRMFMKEYAACGGVPNWMENPAAVDPMERTPEEIADDVPAVEAIPDEKAEASAGKGTSKGGKKVSRVPITKDAIED
jgi:hypothetical protein